MMKKIIYTFLIFLFASGCGYEPIISKNTNFSLKLIELGGNAKINYIVKIKYRLNKMTQRLKSNKLSF